jgi:hypothetical protein
MAAYAVRRGRQKLTIPASGAKRALRMTRPT